mmetsp:Transcript_66873/g.193207  ORF Transcript_66873/g.193207 Transcript_66873/m.193207 type:complete len:380 (-) Transcript_66873:231-1370(-)
MCKLCGATPCSGCCSLVKNSGHSRCNNSQSLASPPSPRTEVPRANLRPPKKRSKAPRLAISSHAARAASTSAKRRHRQRQHPSSGMCASASVSLCGTHASACIPICGTHALAQNWPSLSSTWHHLLVEQPYATSSNSTTHAFGIKAPLLSRHTSLSMSASNFKPSHPLPSLGVPASPPHRRRSSWDKSMERASMRRNRCASPAYASRYVPLGETAPWATTRSLNVVMASNAITTPKVRLQRSSLRRQATKMPRPCDVEFVTPPTSQMSTGTPSCLATCSSMSAPWTTTRPSPPGQWRSINCCNCATETNVFTSGRGPPKSAGKAPVAPPARGRATTTPDHRRSISRMAVAALLGWPRMMQGANTMHLDGPSVPRLRINA